MSPGTYKLFIRDANGCIDNSWPEVDVTSPAEIKVEFETEKYDNFDISCTGYSDGHVWITSTTGGNGGYTYKWSTSNGVITGSDDTDRLDNIPAGTYNVIITDKLGCTKEYSVILTEPEGLQLSSSEISMSADNNHNISCGGGNDGYIKLTVTGGSGSYLFSWAGPNGFTSVTKDIDGLIAGEYTCTVEDINGCLLTPSPSFTLTEPTPLDVTYTTSTSADGTFNINCNGGTGNVNIEATGGSLTGYNYLWTTENGSGIVAGQQNQTALTAGTYQLLVTDLNGCSKPLEITLTEPPELTLQLISTNITCESENMNNGSVDLTVAGGVAPYNYLWSNGSVTEDINNLTEGNYKVTVTYNNTCSVTDSIGISLPPPLSYTKKVSDYNGYNISCYGLANGSIEITSIGGQEPITYNWTGPDGFSSVSRDLSGLKAGSYTLLITDSNFCSAAETIELTEPGKLGIDIILSTSTAGNFNINCAGDATGSITVEPLNEVSSVEYMWSDGLFGKTRTNLPAGDYGLIMKDTNNCYTSSTITLTEPDSIHILFDISEPLCPDMADGEIRLNVSGGVIGTDYEYKWSDNSTNRVLSNILQGYYKVAVTDMNGCTVKDSLRLLPINETCLIVPNVISVNDDLINDVWNIGNTGLYPDMEIKIFNRWGEIVWRSQKGYPTPWDGKSNGISLPMDSYHYIIDLHNGTKPLIGNITIVK